MARQRSTCCLPSTKISTRSCSMSCFPAKTVLRLRTNYAPPATSFLFSCSLLAPAQKTCSRDSPPAPTITSLSHSSYRFFSPDCRGCCDAASGCSKLPPARIHLRNRKKASTAATRNSEFSLSTGGPSTSATSNSAATARLLTSPSWKPNCCAT